MATLATTAPIHPAQPRKVGIWTPAYTLWLREIVRFYRQPARVVGVIASPLLFWFVLGSGFAHSFHSGSSGSNAYLGYFFPGAVVMIVLFTAIFSMMSLIQDRNEGFLLSVMAAPVSRSSIVLGKVLGGATLAAVQGIVFLVFTPLIGVHPDLQAIAISIAVIVMISFELTALGFAIAWPMDSSQAFHGIVNLFLIPLWLVSGALFPLGGASGWIRVIMRLNPLTYGVEALRGLLYPGTEASFPTSSSVATLVLFSLVMFGLAFLMANRSTRSSIA